MSDQPSRIGQEPGSSKSDPTALTTDALHREIAQARELMVAEMNTIRQSIQDQRDLRVAQIETLQQQQTQSEALRKELKADNEKNIDKALIGVEKANEKLEVAITRTLLQMSETSKSDVDGLRRDIDALKDRLNDSKDRVTSLEQQKVGARDDRSGLYAALGAVLLLLTIGSIIAGVMANAGP